MSFSSLYKFALRLKGRGFTLSPKEVQFLKELLERFDEDFIKKTLKRCFQELIPPPERERSSLLRCRKLFQKEKTSRGKNPVYYNPQTGTSTIEEALKMLDPESRRKLYGELREYKRRKGEVSREEFIGYLKVLLRKYL